MSSDPALWWLRLEAWVCGTVKHIEREVKNGSRAKIVGKVKFKQRTCRGIQNGGEITLTVQVKH